MRGSILRRSGDKGNGCEKDPDSKRVGNGVSRLFNLSDGRRLDHERLAPGCREQQRAQKPEAVAQSASRP